MLLPNDYLAHTGPVGIAAGDLNGDGILDLAVANHQSDDVSILIGNGTGGTGGTGDGTFAAPLNLAVGGHNQHVALADFTGDGILDILVSNYNTGRIALLPGNGSDGIGDGTFAAPTSHVAGGWPGRLEVADFNEDGILDVATIDWTGARAVCVLGNGSDGVGDGTFQAPVTYGTGNGPSLLGSADLDRDGVLDLIVPNRNSNTISVLLGNGNGGVGDGTFQAAAGFAVGSVPTAVAAADFNSDGFPDVAVANNGAGTVSILLNTGGVTTFQRAVRGGANLLAVPLRPLFGAWSAWTDVFSGSVPSGVDGYSSSGYFSLSAPSADCPAPGSGFWFFAPADGTISASGVGSEDPPPVRLTGGEGGVWNVVGNPLPVAVPWDGGHVSVRLAGTDEVLPLDEAAEAGWIRDFAWAYRGGEYVPLCDPEVWELPEAAASLPEGEACWVRAFEDCELIFQVAG